MYLYELPFVVRPTDDGFIPADELTAYIAELASPDYKKIRHKDYEATVNHAEAMAVHAVSDPGMDNPKARQLIERTRPNEPDAAQEYRVANYKQITHAAWKKVINTLYNIFNPRLRAVHYPEMPVGIESTLEDYIMDEGIEKFVRDRMFEFAMWDANSVVAVMLREESVGDETRYPEPVPMLFGSEQVIDYKEGKYYLLSKDLDYIPAENMTGKAFILIDSEKYIYIAEFTENGSKYYLITNVIYHAAEMPPVVHMPGEIEKDDLKQSYLSGLLPNWNEALVVKSDYQAVRTRNAHPKAWQIKVKCPSCRGTGRLTSRHLGQGESTCGVCKGSGIKKAQGPGEVLMVDQKAYQEGNMPTPPMGIVEPNPSLLEYLRDDVTSEINAGLSAVNMDHLSKDTNIQESGEAKKVGRTDLNTFMDKIATGIYRAESDILYYVAALRYGATVNPEIITPIIEKPKSYDVRSAEEHAESIRLAKDSGISTGIVDKMQLDFTLKEFGEDSEVYMELKCILDLDPLPGLKPEDVIQVEGDTRDVDRWVHFNLKRYIDQAVDANPNFYVLQRAQKLRIIYDFADAEIAANTPALIPAGDFEGEPGAIDVQAEARAKLKGTVGGVQGILEVQKSVAEGITQYEAGIAILMDIYGFDDPTARKLLGEPVDLRQTTETVPEA